MQYFGCFNSHIAGAKIGRFFNNAREKTFKFVFFYPLIFKLFIISRLYMNKIILVGYMGSGKSTVGKLLAQQLQIPFYDLDWLIEQSEQKSIPTIFELHGEIYFRKVEHLVLNKFIASHSEYVLSLGGGTPCYANNHEILQLADVTSIYLKTAISELVTRLKNSSNVRPLLLDKNEAELTEYVAKHLFDRSYYYHQSKQTILTDGKTTSDVVKAIISALP